jgi:hypothetical protein
MVHTGNVQPSIDAEEHDETYGTKKVSVFGYTGTSLAQLLTDSSGAMVFAGSLVPKSFDYIAITWNGSNPTKLVYKTGGATGTTVATLDITWSGSNPTTVTRT